MSAPATLQKKKVTLTPKDKKLLKDFADIKKNVEKAIESFRFHEAADMLYHYVWHELADNIIEKAKPRLQGSDLTDTTRARELLRTLLLESIIALHPFMPFVTEAVYQEHYAHGKNDFLAAQSW